jgi:lipoprotein-anchoring transpeptidase ErfK/SrfK
MRRSYAVYAAGAAAATVSAVLAAPGGTVVGSAALRHGSEIAWLKEGSVELHPTPGSPQVSATIASRTEFGSRTSLPVVAARGAWLEVISTKLRNGVYGFIRLWQVRLTRSPVAIDVDLSGRLLRLWRRGTVVLRAAVGIGAARTPTPIGRFGVTDKLTGVNPAGGGGIGAATSNGCLHATEAVLRRLMRRVPLGTQVVVHP